MIPTPVKLFISYSHDSDEHRERVLALSERLRADGIETLLDRYVNGTPVEGWPRWMLNGLDAVDRVLLVCTPTYYRRFRGHEEPGQGKGGDWEGAVITQAIYDARSATTRFIPVLFDPADASQIPEPVRGHTHYCLTAGPAYQALYDALLEQAGVAPGPVGRLKRKEREQGRPLTFDEANPTEAAISGHKYAVPEPAEPTRPSPALAIWQEKLDYLLAEEAVAADPAQKFKLGKDIEECRAKIRALGGST
jgi:hypothetical protein